MADPEMDAGGEREAPEAPEQDTEAQPEQPAPPDRPSRPAPPRIAIRVIDHPTDWVDNGSDETPRVSTVINRLPSFDASFFDAPPTNPVAPAEGIAGGLKFHTGAEQDASFGDFVGGGDTDADAELPTGVTAAVRRTAPLSPETVATTAAAVQFGVAEPAPVDVVMPRRDRYDDDRRRSRRRTTAIAIPAFFAMLMVLTVLLTRGPSRPRLDAAGVTTTTTKHAASTTVAPRPTTTAGGPTTTAPAATDASGSQTTGTVGAAQAGTPSPAGPGVGHGNGGGGGSPPPVTTPVTSPPTTTPRTTPPTTSPPPPTTACPPYICH